jgi:hypothetical protein
VGAVAVLACCGITAGQSGTQHSHVMDCDASQCSSRLMCSVVQYKVERRYIRCAAQWYVICYSLCTCYLYAVHCTVQSDAWQPQICPSYFWCQVILVMVSVNERPCSLQTSVQPRGQMMLLSVCAVCTLVYASLCQLSNNQLCKDDLDLEGKKPCPV